MRNLTTSTINYSNINFTVTGVWSGQYNYETNERPEFELHTIEINENDVTDLLNEETKQGIIDELLNQ